MTSLDSKVAALVDRPATDSDDEDALISQLEDDDELDAFREQTLQQLHAEYSKAKELRASDHGRYVEIKDEKELMDITTKARNCIVHFFKPDFGRCGIMDGHLESLAPSHYETRFLRINVENAPFLITKLKVQVLPCVISFIDGITVDRIIGFEQLAHNGSDNFSTRELEARLLTIGVLVRAKVEENVGAGRKTIFGSKKQAQEDDDDDDWD